MTFLTGEKVRLVGFTERFITAKYLSWLNDQDVNQYLYVGRFPATIEEARARVERYGNHEIGIMFAIMTNLAPRGDKIEQTEEFSEFVGSISLSIKDSINRNAEIGLMIGSKEHWGKGLAGEAIRLTTEYGFNRLNLHKIEAGVIEANAASSRAFLKNGYIHYATIPEQYFLDGRYWDEQRFYKLQDK
jgi:RimJ/RimL family protein N-acetyltransferase